MEPSEPYETLDPENWDEMRALAHRMVDDAMTYLRNSPRAPGLATGAGRGSRAL